MADCPICGRPDEMTVTITVGGQSAPLPCNKCCKDGKMPDKLKKMMEQALGQEQTNEDN